MLRGVSCVGDTPRALLLTSAKKEVRGGAGMSPGALRAQTSCARFLACFFATANAWQWIVTFGHVVWK